MRATGWAVFAVGVAASIALSLIFNGLFLFLLGPLLLFGPWRQQLTGQGPMPTCETCGYQTMHPAVRYCPHDGTRLGRPPQ